MVVVVVVVAKQLYATTGIGEGRVQWPADQEEEAGVGIQASEGGPDEEK